MSTDRHDHESYPYYVTNATNVSNRASRVRLVNLKERAQEVNESSPRQRQQTLYQKQSAYETMNELRESISNLEMDELSKLISLKAMEIATHVSDVFEKQLDEASFKLNRQVIDMIGVHQIKPLSPVNLDFFAEEVSTSVFSKTTTLPHDTVLVLKPITQHKNYGSIMCARNENIEQFGGIYFSKYGFCDVINTKKEQLYGYHLPGCTVVGDNYITYGVQEDARGSTNNKKPLTETLVNTEPVVAIKREVGFSPKKAYVYCNKKFLGFKHGGYKEVTNPQECYKAIAKCAQYHGIHYLNEDS